jgi:hypothetical protein
MKYLKYILVAFLIISTHMGFSERRVFTDNEIKQQILHYIAPKCGIPGKRKKLVDTYCINGDTNRMLRLLSDLIATNDEWICTRSMWQYGKYATKSELPFLYICATNWFRGEYAMRAILRIEGVTTNSLPVMESFLSLTNVSSSGLQERDQICCEFIRYERRRTIEEDALRKSVKELVYRYASYDNQCHEWLDKELMLLDDTYQYSRRRLNVFSSITNRWINPYSYNYVTNVIKTLEAYPKSDLPD